MADKPAWRKSILNTDPRRLLAVLAMCLGLGLAWWSSRPHGPHVELIFLLTHTQLALPTGPDGGAVVLDRSRLVQFAWLSPTSDGTVRRQAIDFAAGTAPEALPIQVLDLPEGATTVEIACRFQLIDGSPPVRTRGRVTVDPQRTEMQTVDVESCGDLVR